MRSSSSDSLSRVTLLVLLFSSLLDWSIGSFTGPAWLLVFSACSSSSSSSLTNAKYLDYSGDLIIVFYDFEIILVKFGKIQNDKFKIQNF
ncbi:hypothetical protein BpHYR1_051629 [Brachionus plicatilis]|uniref:Uncharacterized protein n=1 Tax=Brachionus plicatilis TaxID=10195 RepID=A0A3M7PIJ1_BRAPC|nr:hypothetical protein BpHYR1_051629 [Brachionus plicatilis]